MKRCHKHTNQSTNRYNTIPTGSDKHTKHPARTGGLEENGLAVEVVESLGNLGWRLRPSVECQGVAPGGQDGAYHVILLVVGGGWGDKGVS